MKRVDLFCYKHPRFGINNLMMIICIGNIAVWLFSAMDTTGMLRELLAFSPYHILRGQIWRLVTFVFLPLYSSPFSLSSRSISTTSSAARWSGSGARGASPSIISAACCCRSSTAS